MWTAIKEKNEAAFLALSGEMKRCAMRLAEDWLAVSVIAEMACMQEDTL